MSAGNYGFVFIVAQSELITSDSTRYEPEHMIDQQHTLHADNTDVTVTRVNYRTSKTVLAITHRRWVQSTPVGRCQCLHSTINDNNITN